MYLIQLPLYTYTINLQTTQTDTHLQNNFVYKITASSLKHDTNF